MKRINQTLTTALLLFSLVACKKSSEEKKVDPTNANELQSVLVIPGGSLTSGNPPASTGTGTSPQITSSQSSGSVNAGNQATIPFNYSSNSGYTNCYVQVNGATNGYFTIPTNSSTNAGTINIPVTVPSNVNSGQFCVTYCIADAQGRVSNRMTYCVNVTGTSTPSTGTGSGSFSINGTNYSGLCTKANNDVVISTQTGDAFVIYNMPTASSGSFSFTDGYASLGTTNLYGLLNQTSTGFSAGTKPTGSVTKTGAKSFTFSSTVYDISTNVQKTISGSGTWQ